MGFLFVYMKNDSKPVIYKEKIQIASFKKYQMKDQCTTVN